MKNIAILIGNSDYSNLEKLEFCKKDIELMRKMLELSKKFEIKVFENYRSERLKEELANFIKENQDTEIGDLLFYYTGHGFFEKQFFYLPINFDKQKFATTSLSNDELDNMLRSLNAKLFVKIIDACHSGQQYIKDKDTNIVEKYFEERKFNKCYFFFSSLNNQVSYGDKNGSKFTVAIIDSIINHTENSIRYRDIQSYIADYFQDNEQTPFFIQQADATEFFLTDLSNIKESEEFKLNNEYNNDSEEATNQIIEDIDDFKLLKSLSKQYVSKEEAKEIIDYIFSDNKLIKCIDSKIYDSDVKPYSNYKKVKRINVLYNEIDSNKEKFFVNISYRNEEYKTIEQVPKRYKFFGQSINISYPLFNYDYEEKEVTKIRKVVDDIFAKDDILPIGVSIILTPKKEFAILSKYIINIINIHNDINIIIYSNFIKCNKDNWETWNNEKSENWVKRVYLFKDKEKIRQIVINIIEKYYEKIKEDIEKIIKNASPQINKPEENKINEDA